MNPHPAGELLWHIVQAAAGAVLLIGAVALLVLAASILDRVFNPKADKPEEKR